MKLSLFSAGATESRFSVISKLDSDGWFRLPSLTGFERPLPAGRYVVRLETLPFEFGVQEDWIVDAVGERGKELPHSATKPVDPEFPHHGRRMEEDRQIELSPLAPETCALEALKQKVFTSDGGRSGKSLEEVLRDRFAARPDEQPANESWLVQQVGEARWIVMFAFTRRGRPVQARWEVNCQSGDIRYLDPEAKALSFG
jgi:hypothetical protein